MGWIVGPASGVGKDDGHTGEELTDRELREQQSRVVGLPMFDDHNYKKLIGRIAGTFMKDGRLWIVGKVNEETKWGKEAYEKIKSGTYGGLSLGTFGVKDDKTEEISDRLIAEASPCPGKEGRRPGTSIVLTMNSGTDIEHQVTMTMTDIGGVKPLGFAGDVPFDAPGNMIQDVVTKAQQFLQEHLCSSGMVPPATPTSSPGEGPSGDSSISNKEDKHTCKSCKRKFDEDRKSNTSSSGSNDTEMKEGTKSSILSKDQDNTKKIDQVNSTLTEGRSINTVEGTSESSSTQEKSHKRSKTMEKTVHFDSPDLTDSEGGKQVDESFKNDQLDLSGAVDAPLAGSSTGAPFTGVNVGTPTPPTMTSLPTTPIHSGDEVNESQFMQEPTQAPGSATDKGKRKATEQPRNDKGQWTKKAKPDEEGSSGDSDINSLLNKLGSNKSGSEGSTVTLSRDDLAGLFEKIQSAQSAQKERDEALQRERELRMKLERDNKSLEKQSKHSQISSLLKKAKASIKAAKDLGADSTDEDAAFFQEEANAIKTLIKDEDAMYNWDKDAINNLQRRSLILTKASNTANRKIAQVQGSTAAQLKKFESLLKDTGNSSFDASSGRKRGAPEVSSGDKFGNLLKQMEGASSSGGPAHSAPPVGGATGVTQTSSSYSQTQTQTTRSPYSVPTFAGANSIRPGLVPFRMSAVCTEKDPNKGIFDAIERDLSGGGFFGFTDVDIPGITDREWYDKPFRIPGREAVGRATHMQLPTPGWARQRY